MFYSAQNETQYCRDNQAISAVKAAISKPKTRGYPLIECEFPPLKELNKLGDGSMRSANEVDQVGTPLFFLSFCVPEHADHVYTVMEIHLLSNLYTNCMAGKFGILLQVDQIYCSSTHARSQNMAADQFCVNQ